MIKLFQLYFKVLGVIAPNVAASQALYLFQRVDKKKKKLREREYGFYEKARNYKIDSHPEPVDVYELGPREGYPVILVHGWESNAGSLSAIANALSDQGKRVILFNMLGHGFSKFNYNNMIIAKDMLLKLLAEIEIKDNFSIVGHSFGSGIIAYALRKTNIQVDKIVFLTNADRIIDVLEGFTNLMKLSSNIIEKLQDKISDLLGFPIEELVVSDYVQEVDYKKLLLLHDKHDKVINVQCAENVALKASNTELIKLEKVGHYRMLWNQDVIKRVVTFIIEP